jgi:hypothetical protein
MRKPKAKKFPKNITRLPTIGNQVSPRKLRIFDRKFSALMNPKNIRKSQKLRIENRRTLDEP